MNGGGQRFKRLRVGNGPRGRGVPLKLAGRGGGVANQLKGGNLACGEGLPEGCAEHSRGAGQKNFGRRRVHKNWIDSLLLRANAIRIGKAYRFSGIRIFFDLDNILFSGAS